MEVSKKTFRQNFTLKLQLQYIFNVFHVFSKGQRLFWGQKLIPVSSLVFVNIYRQNNTHFGVDFILVKMIKAKLNFALKVFM